MNSLLEEEKNHRSDQSSAQKIARERSFVWGGLCDVCERERRKIGGNGGRPVSIVNLHPSPASFGILVDSIPLDCVAFCGRERQWLLRMTEMSCSSRNPAESQHLCGCPQHILDYLQSRLGVDSLANLSIVSAKSAQQQVWILSNLLSADETSYLPPDWNNALHVGQNRLVVRQWKASSCWWNLNRNHQTTEEIESLARSEIAGYRIAQKVLSAIHIPSILYFSAENNPPSSCQQEQQQQVLQQHPWAILSYVGEDSLIFHKITSDDWKLDESWSNGMVKTRFEFGFQEPHPRWGRVPVDQCLVYTLSILRNLTIPLHRYIRQHSSNMDELSSFISCLRGPRTRSDQTSNSGATGFTYTSMVNMYQRSHQEMQQFKDTTSDSRLQAAIRLLGKAVMKLTEQRPYLDPPLQPFVLCHMDCQPQNLIFAKSKMMISPSSSMDDDNGKSSNTEEGLPRISSVLDWEEAALADARFELLLLCRKVCANRSQAEQVWRTYQQECPQPALGDVQPWLVLETVHSITSMMLQSMDLLGGGRNPWETKPDLWGKIQREIQRLVVEYGWDFCNVPEFQ
jgi:thiamine kinase-like enzyme